MKRAYLILSAVLLTVTMQAQTYRGDMDADGKLDIEDVTALVSTVLGRTEKQLIQVVDNSPVTGLWYKTKNESVAFLADGTTNYEGASKYKYIPALGYIVLCNFYGTATGILNVTSLTGETLCINGETTYTKHVPQTYVSSVSLNANTIQLYAGSSVQLTATVLPSDAENKTLIWSSSNEKIATVTEGLVTAAAEGTATITCTAADGSGVKASCQLTVSPKGNPGSQTGSGSGA